MGSQIGLRALFLLMAAIAVWVIYFNNRRNIAALEIRITAMRPLAHELIIDDVNKIAVVKLAEMWYDENRWEIHLPDGQYRICLATRGIDQQGLAPVVKSERLGAGKHLIELEQERESDGARVIVSWDRVELISIREPKEWDPGSGSAGGGAYSQSTQLAADQPVILFRRRFSLKGSTGQITAPDGPTEGVLLWIEPISNSPISNSSVDP